jgi:hypothetical protein
MLLLVVQDVGAHGRRRIALGEPWLQAAELQDLTMCLSFRCPHAMFALIRHLGIAWPATAALAQRPRVRKVKLSPNTI